MRRLLIAGNWKMNKSITEAVELAREIAAGVKAAGSIDVAVFPPFIAIAAVAEALAGSEVAVGAQNLHHLENGAFTGEISPAMLVGLCQFVIAGHSERRALFAESDEVVGRKVRAAIDHGLTPILCVGESLQEWEQGRTREVLSEQAGRGLERVTAKECAGLVVAYEPVWAIGTGRNATPAQASEAITSIRGLIEERFGRPAAGGVRILYGGSVSPGNWESIIGVGQVDGALVGGASLNAADFIQLVRISLAARGLGPPTRRK